MDRKVLDQLSGMLSTRVDAWEVCIIKKDFMRIEAREGKVDNRSEGKEEGVSIRVIDDGRPGFSFASSQDSLAGAVENALSFASQQSPDRHASFFSGPTYLEKRGEYLDNSFGRVGDDEMNALLMESIDTAMTYSTKVKRVRRASFSKTKMGIILWNSNNLALEDERSDFLLMQEVIAEDGDDSVISWDYSFAHYFKEIDPRSTGLMSAKRAVELLGGKREKTGALPAVIMNLPAAELVSVLGKSFLSESVSKNKSMLKGREGERVFSDEVTLMDSGIVPSGWNSFSFDGEGVRSRQTELVRNGVLNGLLYDQYYANIFGRSSTGNSRRENFMSPPVQNVTNIFIKNGKTEIGGLLKEMGDGIYITGIMGLHTANPVTGEFSLGAEGYRIKNGQNFYPVRGITISGNIFSLFNDVVAVGSDIRFLASSGAPSLLVKKIMIGGE